MPWDKLADAAPALVAVIMLSVIFAGLVWKMIAAFIQTIKGTAKDCHDNHNRVADITAEALDRNTEALGSCRACQAETTKAMQEVTVTLRMMNGRSKE